MSEERKRILDMLAAGRISAEEAEKLLDALSETEHDAAPRTAEAGSGKVKYLKIIVDPGPASERRDRVNIRVPLGLIRAGLRWAAFVPKDVQSRVSEALREKGIALDWTKFTPEEFEGLISELNDLTVDVEGQDKIRIFCE